MKIPENISLTKNGQYCLDCYSEQVKRVYKNDLTYYYCSNCRKTLDRSLVIDNALSFWVDKNNNYWHKSSGVIVIYEDKVLVQLRKIFPFSYSIPAGHVDKGEDPLTAAKRELLEETGINFNNLEFVESFEINADSCRRGSDDHQWNLYKVKVFSDSVNISDEASTYKWLTYDELCKEENLTFPLKFILNKYGKSLFL